MNEILDRAEAAIRGGSISDAVEMLSRLAAAASRHGAHAVEAEALAALVGTSLLDEDLQGARSHAAQCLETARSLDLPIASSFWLRTMDDLRAGGAETRARLALEIAREALRDGMPEEAFRLGRALLGDALPGRRIADQEGIQLHVCRCRVELAARGIEATDWESAETHLRSAVETARSHLSLTNAVEWAHYLASVVDRRATSSLAALLRARICGEIGETNRAGAFLDDATSSASDLPLDALALAHTTRLVWRVKTGTETPAGGLGEYECEEWVEDAVDAHPRSMLPLVALREMTLIDEREGFDVKWVRAQARYWLEECARRGHRRADIEYQAVAMGFRAEANPREEPADGVFWAEIAGEKVAADSASGHITPCMNRLLGEQRCMALCHRLSGLAKRASHWLEPSTMRRIERCGEDAELLGDANVLGFANEVLAVVRARACQIEGAREALAAAEAHYARATGLRPYDITLLGTRAEVHDAEQRQSAWEERLGAFAARRLPEVRALEGVLSRVAHAFDEAMRDSMLLLRYGRVPVLRPQAERSWPAQHAHWDGKSLLLELAPAENPIGRWTELMTVTSTLGQIPMEMWATMERRTRESDLVGGRLRWAEILSTSTSYMAVCEIEGDLARGEKTEILRLERRSGRLMSLRVAARREALQRFDREGWIARLRSSIVVQMDVEPLRELHAWRAGALERAPFPQWVFEQVGEPSGPGHLLQLSVLLERALAACDSRIDGDTWHRLLQMYGTALLPDREIEPEVAESSLARLRDAHEIVSSVLQPASWAWITSMLCMAALQRGREDDRPRVVTALERTVQMLETVGDENGRATALEWLGFAYTTLGRDAGGDNLRRAVDAFARAQEVLSRESAPKRWATIQTGICDAYLQMGEPGNIAHAELGRLAVYDLGRVPPDAGGVALDHGDLEAVMSRFAMLQMGVKEGSNVPLAMPPGRSKVERRLVGPQGKVARLRKGSALFFRPFAAGGALLVPNRFSPEARARLPEVPDEAHEVSVEWAIVRALSFQIQVQAVAGDYGELSGSRVVADDWKAFVTIALDKCFNSTPREGPLLGNGQDDFVLVFCIPDASPGVEWEIRALIDRRLLPRCVFVMPPSSRHCDVPLLWARATEALSTIGLVLPPYREDGRLLMFSQDHRLDVEWPFDVIWSGSLLDRLDPLLPAPRPRRTAHLI